jgi:hypothetical protein
MAEEELMIVGIRNKPNILVAAGSKLFPCLKCQADTWIGPAGQKMVQEQRGKVICVGCYLKVGTFAQTHPPTPEMLEEIFQTTGHRMTEEEAMSIMFELLSQRYTPSQST